MKYTLQHQQQGVELMKSLVEKAWENAQFKDQLMKEPRQTLESFTGEKLSDETKIIVEDQSNPEVIYFNIPRQVSLDNLELTDEQLEIVAGGEVAVTAGIALAAVGLFAAGIAIGQNMK